MISIIATKNDLQQNRYLPESQLSRKGNVRFMQPDGVITRAKNVFVTPPGLINEISLEYLAMEFTRHCNVRCSHCYVAATTVNGEKPVYIDLDFLVELAEQLKDAPEGYREICITGGEPTLDLKKLITRYWVFNEKIPGANIVIATNLVAIPFSEQGIADFFSKFPEARIQASYSPYLEAQYKILANQSRAGEDQKHEGCIPQNVSPENALLEKIRLFDDYAHKHQKKFMIRVNAATPEATEESMERVKSYLGSKGRDEGDFIYSSRVIKVGKAKSLKGAIDADQAARQCTQSEEVYMCSNGDLYPTVNHIDNPENRIGRLVKLL